MDIRRERWALAPHFSESLTVIGTITDRSGIPMTSYYTVP